MAGGRHHTRGSVGVRTLRPHAALLHKALFCVMASSRSRGSLGASHRCAPCGYTKTALCKVAYAGSGRISRWRSPVAARPTRQRLSPCRYACTWASARRCAHRSGQWPAARPWVLAPAHPWGSLAAQRRPRGLPVRPPGGLPQNRAGVTPPAAADTRNPGVKKTTGSLFSLICISAICLQIAYRCHKEKNRTTISIVRFPYITWGG